MRVSVVVPTWRRPGDLARCLGGLSAQVRKADEVVVVVRRDDAETRMALADRRDLPLREAVVGGRGVLEALRRGIEASSGDVIAITDDDAVPRPNWLKQIEAAFERDPSLGGVGGRDYVHQDGGVLDDGQPTVGRVRWYGRVIGNHHLGVGPPRQVELLKGVNMALSREALNGIPLPEGLRGGGAQVHWEVDLCLALTQRGWRLLYDPEVAVDHFPAARFDADQRTERPLDAIENEVFNLTYALLQRLPRHRAGVALAYGLLVGTRGAPGLVVALERTLRGRRAQGALRVSQRARLAALRVRLQSKPGSPRPAEGRTSARRSG